MGPEVLLATAIASSLAGTAVSSYGMIQQGRAQERQANAQARVQQSNALQQGYDAETNAQIAEANEKEALYAAHEQRARVLDQTRRDKASATAALSRRGLDLGSVSFQDVLTSTVMQAETEANDIAYQGYLQARSSRYQAQGFRRKGERAFTLGQFSSGMTKAAGKNAKRSAYFSAAGNTLSGLGNAASLGT